MARDERPLTVACVLRSGGIYDAQWVMKLKRGVSRNLTRPHRFVCLTDMHVPCESIRITRPWRGWWSKLGLFDLFTGPTLYFDLDTVVVGSLDRIAAHPHTFTMAHEYYRPHMKCSTAMAWCGDYAFIARAFAMNPNSIARRYDKDLRPRIGDQAFIEDQLASAGKPVATFKDLFGETSVASYKVHKCEAAPPDGAAVVAFHGRPKPGDIKRGWVPELWQ